MNRNSVFFAFIFPVHFLLKNITRCYYLSWPGTGAHALIWSHQGCMHVTVEQLCVDQSKEHGQKISCATMENISAGLSLGATTRLRSWYGTKLGHILSLSYLCVHIVLKLFDGLLWKKSVIYISLKWYCNIRFMLYYLHGPPSSLKISHMPVSKLLFSGMKRQFLQHQIFSLRTAVRTR
jgi:hypothetical protein